MLGEFVDDYTVKVVDVFAMPQSGTGVSVEAVDPVFQTKMLDMLKQCGRYIGLCSSTVFSSEVPIRVPVSSLGPLSRLCATKRCLVGNNVKSSYCLIIGICVCENAGQRWWSAGTTVTLDLAAGFRGWTSTHSRCCLSYQCALAKR